MKNLKETTKVDFKIEEQYKILELKIMGDSVFSYRFIAVYLIHNKFIVRINPDFYIAETIKNINQLFIEMEDIDSFLEIFKKQDPFVTLNK